MHECYIDCHGSITTRRRGPDGLSSAVCQLDAEGDMKSLIMVIVNVY